MTILRFDRYEPASGSNAGSPAGAMGGDWQNHEHVTEVTHGQAQQLIESAGSAALAKHAIDVVGQQAAAPESTVAAARSSEVESPPEAQTKLAHALGYASYLDLFESSKAADDDGERHWLVTAESGGGWVFWNDVEFEIEGRFDSQQAALTAAAAPSRKPK